MSYTNYNNTYIEAQKEGWMRKKGGRVNMWGERYFSLRGQTLYYYLKATDSVN